MRPNVESHEYQELLRKRQYYRIFKEDYVDMMWVHDTLARLEAKSSRGMLDYYDYDTLQKAKAIAARVEAKALAETSQNNTTEYFVWRTAGDDKVRPAHAERNGQIFSWAEGPYPGEDYNCRCWAEPYAGEGEKPQATPPKPKPRPAGIKVHNSQEITIYHTNGTSETRTGGSIAWRNNNPGNLRSGTFSTRHGAIGENSGFAVFPDENTGYKASKALLETETYQNLTVNEAIARRSPSSENNTDVLQNEVIRDSGIAGDRPMDDLSEGELDRLLHSIHKFEGWIEGEVDIERSTD